MSSSCLIAIKTKLPVLTPAERRIADYVLQHSERVVSMSVADLADNAAVAGSAVVRFCRTVGFRGYSDLKLSLAAELSKNHQLNYVPYIEPEDGPDQIIDKVFSANVKTLHDTAAQLNRTVFRETVELLSRAHMIYIYGIGTSAGIVTDFQYRLMQQGYTTLGFTDITSIKISTINIRPGDAAIGISHTGQTAATVDALRLARQRGAKTVCITSYPGSLIARESDYPIEVYSDEIHYPIEAVSARIAHISVTDAITISLSAKNRTESFTRSKTTQELLDTLRYNAKEQPR